MSRQGNLIKNTFIISLGTFLPKLTSIITMPILTAYLTKSEYGSYDLIMTLVALFLPVVTLQIQSAAFRFLIDRRDDEEEKKSIISNIMFFVALTSFIALIVLYFCLYKFSPLVRLLISFYFFFDIILQAVQQSARGLSYNLFYSISSVINSTVQMIAIVLLVKYMPMGLSGVLIAMIVSLFTGIAFLFFKAKLWKYISIGSVSFKTIGKMLAYSWPMVPNNMSNWVLSLSNRLVITAALGLEANALFAVANKLPYLLKTVQGTFVLAWQENASLAVKDKDSSAYYSMMFDNIFCILTGIMALLIGASPVLFAILVRGDYQTAYYQMPILYMGMMFSCLAAFVGGIYIAHMKTKSVGITTVCAAACNLIINVGLINFIGITSASIATLVSYLILTLYRMLDVRRFQPISYNFKKMGLFLAVLVVMCLINVQRVWWFDLINIAIGAALILVADGKIIKEMLSSVLQKLQKRGSKDA